MGKRELILVLFVRLFDLCLFGFVLEVLSVSSSSWCLGRIVVCDCGTPWTFLLLFWFQYYVFRDTYQWRSLYGIICTHTQKRNLKTLPRIARGSKFFPLRTAHMVKKQTTVEPMARTSLGPSRKHAYIILTPLSPTFIQ